MAACSPSPESHVQTTTGAQMTRAYDRFTQESHLLFEGFRLKWADATRLKASKTLKRQAHTENVFLIFQRIDQSKWRWNEKTSVIALVDGKLPFPLQIQYQNQAVSTAPNPSLDETITIPLEANAVSAMEAARTLEFRIGDVEYALDGEQIAQFQEFLLTPTVTKRAVTY